MCWPCCRRKVLIITGGVNEFSNFNRCLFCNPNDPSTVYANFSGSFASSGITWDGYFHTSSVQFYNKSGTLKLSGPVPGNSIGVRGVRQSEIYKINRERFILGSSGSGGSARTRKYQYNVQAGTITLVEDYIHAIGLSGNIFASCAESMADDRLFGGQLINHGLSLSPLQSMQVWQESGNGNTAIGATISSLGNPVYPTDIRPARRPDNVDGFAMYVTPSSQIAEPSTPTPILSPSWRVMILTGSTLVSNASFSARTVIPNVDPNYPASSNFRARQGIYAERCPVVPGDYYVHTDEVKTVSGNYHYLFKMNDLNSLLWSFPGTPYFYPASNPAEMRIHQAIATDPDNGSVYTIHRVGPADSRVRVVKLDKDTGSILSSIIPSDLDPLMTRVNGIHVGYLV